MRKLFSVLFVCLITVSYSWAIPAHKGKKIVTQPDGTTVTLQLHGDEYMNFTTTDDGYTVVKCADNFFRFARKEKGKLVATDIVAHDTDKRTADERTFIASTKKYIAPDMSAQMQEMRKNNILQQKKALAQHRAGQFDYDNFRGLIILVEFNDKEFSRKNYPDIIFDMVNKENYTGYDDTEYGRFTGSVRDYFYDNSNGLFSPQFDVVGPVKVNYNQNDGKLYPFNIFLSAVQHANPLVDFSKYDRDGNGAVDLIYFICAGSPSSSDPSSPDHIWPHRSSFYSYNKYDGVYIRDYACSAEFIYSEENDILDGIGTFCHEFSHVLGLADHYDTNEDDDAVNGESLHPGEWDIMAGGNYQNHARTPVGYNLYERYTLGFATPQVISEKGNYTLMPINESNTGYRLDTPVDKEFFLIENRQKTAKWDQYLPGQGMLVFRVDSTDASVWTSNQPNGDARRLYFELLRAGGSTTLQSPSDPFPGTKNVTELSNGTSPANLLSWTGKPTKWGLKNICEQNGVICFDIEEDVIILNSITLPEAITLSMGTSQILMVTFIPSYAEEEITWTSSNSSIASIDADGKVTGMKEGTCTITAISASGKKATCIVTVIQGYISIPEAITLAEGDSYDLTVTFHPANMVESVTWTSSDNSIATVDENGKVTGEKGGTCTITATTASGKTASCIVTVIGETVTNSIAEFKALPKGAEAFLILNDARVIFNYSNGYDVYIHDGTGGIALRKIQDRKKFYQWDIVNGRVYGKCTYSVTNKMPTLTAVEGKTNDYGYTIDMGEEFPPREVSLDELTQSNYADYVVIKNVELKYIEYASDFGNITDLFAVKGDKCVRFSRIARADDAVFPTDVEGKRFDVTCIFGTDMSARLFNGKYIDELYLLKTPEEVGTNMIESVECCDIDSISVKSYNISGQRVDDNYNGIIIYQGKKYVKK